MEADDFWPSIHAAEGLSLAGHGHEVRIHLRGLLKTETDLQKRCGLARELVRAGDRRQVAEMIRILEADDTHGHVHAAESLYKVHGLGNAVGLLTRMQTGQNRTLQLMAAAALARSGHEEALGLIRRQLAHEDQDTSRIAAWIIARVGDRSDIVRLRKALPNIQGAFARCYFEHALALLGDPEGRRLLRRNLTSEDAAVRTYAATFGGEGRFAEIVPDLVKMLEDPHLDARYRAAQALLEMSRPESATRFRIRRHAVQAPGVDEVSIGIDNAHLVHTTQLFPRTKSTDLNRQAQSLLQQLDRLLVAHGTPRGELVRVHLYATDPAARRVVEDAIMAWVPGGCRPAVSAVSTRLPRAGSRVALDAIFPANQIVASDRVTRQGQSGFGVARSAVLPRGDAVYVSGQAVQGTLIDATRATMKGLLETLSFLDVRHSDVAQVKCFVTPVTDGARVIEAIADCLPRGAVPPIVLVEWQSGSYPIEIELVGWRTGSRHKQPITYSTPPGLKASPVFSRVATIHDPYRLYTAGHVSARDRDQVAGVFDLLKQSLTPHGGGFRHLAKATYYVTNGEASQALNKIRPSLYDPQRPPAASKALVRGVGVDGRTVSIDLIGTPTRETDGPSDH